MSVIASLYPLYPDCSTYGFTVEPRYLVKVVQREGGYERRDKKWSRPLNMYTAVPTGERRSSDMQTLLNFWHAMGGIYQRFRFKDWADYKSCFVDSTVSALDQPLQLVSGSPGGYRLIKNYTFGTFVQPREIIHPKGSSILIANQLGQVQSTSTYQVEEDTGLITTLGGFSGTPNSWGGEFYVPARFNSEFAVEITNFKIHSIQFAVCELRIPLE
jgi:uncharacterized protein (TIGR02217 family)